MTSSVTSSAPGSSVGRSTSLPNVIVCEDHRQRRGVASLDPPLMYYAGSLRHKDSILLRKSKLRQTQLRPSIQRRLSGETLKINNVSNGSNGEDFDNRSQLSPRPRVSSNRVMSNVGQGHARVIDPCTRGTWLPEYEERNCREPPSSRQLSRRHFSGGNEEMVHRNSTNKLTVILSAVDLPYASRSPFHCECQAAIDVRCLPNNAWRGRDVTTTQYLVESQPVSDERLRKYPIGTWSRNLELDKRKVHHEGGLSSSSPSPEPFTRQRSPSADYDTRLACNGSQFSGAPVAVTSERHVYALARAYSDRVKQLQCRSTASHRAEHFDVCADVHLQVRGATARSASVGRRAVLPSPPVLHR